MVMICMVIWKVLLPAVLVSAGSDGVDCPAACQRAQVDAYFRALDAVFREGSTVADVDALLAPLHEDVRYVHVAYEADFDRAVWRAAFVGNLERGAFRNGPERRIGVLNAIHGKDHAAIAYAHGAVGPDGTWEGDESLLVLFTFTDGQISRIEELWQAAGAVRDE